MGLILLILFILLCIVLGVALLRWLPRGRKIGGIEPRCAACGYIVHGLPTPVCPECGSRLDLPGAVVTAGRLPPGRVARSVAWTIFCAMAVFFPILIVWSSFIEPALPQVRQNSTVITLSNPGSGGYRFVCLRANAKKMVYRNDPDPSPDNLTFEISRSDGTIKTLEIESATLHYCDTSNPSSAMSATALDADQLVAWMSSIGVKGEPDRIHQEMTTAITQIRQSVSRPPIRQMSGSGEFGGMSSSSGSSTSPLPWPQWVPVAIAGAVWLIGLIRILRTPARAAG